jgi:hypothetical protein
MHPSKVPQSIQTAIDEIALALDRHNEKDGLDSLLEIENFIYTDEKESEGIFDCDMCKYDPANATQEMRDNGPIIKIGWVFCYHPDAYKKGIRNDYFWSTAPHICFVRMGD